MKFTLVFESNETEDKSYGLVFTPYPCWIKGQRELIELSRESMRLEPGCLRELIYLEELRGHDRCVLVVHNNGNYGDANSLDTIVKSLICEGIEYKIVEM